MRSVLKLALAACVALAPCAQGQVKYAQGGQPYTRSMTWLMSTKPFRPILTTNDDPAICAPFLAAWTRAFESEEALDEDAVDLAAAYPAGVYTELPDRKGATFYNNSLPLRIDFDGDGDKEVLHFDSEDIGWRYLAVDVYLFNSEAEYEIAAQNKDYQSYGELSLDDHETPIPGAPYRKLFTYAPIGNARLITIGGRIYTETRPGRTDLGRDVGDGPARVSLVQLNAPDKPREVCTVQVYPPKADHLEFLESSPLLVAAADVYGGPTSECQGTMGWTARPYDTSLADMLYRPWAMKAPPASEVGEPTWRRRDAMRELSYLWWGLNDPQSWRDYLEVKASRPQFIDEIRAYYLANFTKSEVEATRFAEWAWRRMLDNLSYSGGDKGQWSWRGDAGLSLTPASTPDEIARVMVSTLDAYIGKVTSDSKQEITSTLLAAIYTRQPTETVKKLTDQWYALAAADIARVQPGWPDRPKVMKENYARQAQLFLLAALGHTGLTNVFLDRGIDPDAGTNWFGKTPLMYAAQSDQLNAVRTLVARGVSVNTATKANGNCGRLQRDNRTALMYAAENASEPVIVALIAAGADIAAKDTQGNTVLWYFSRNTRIIEPVVRARITARLGG